MFGELRIYDGYVVFSYLVVVVSARISLFSHRPSAHT